MKISRSKTTAAVISLFLMLAMAISLVALPDANAQTTPTAATYCYLGALPNPVGVGQEVLFHVGVTKELNLANMGWDDLSITIKKPDGTTETISNIRTDSTGGTGRNFIPQVAGNYTCQGHFPEQLTTADKVAGGFFTPQLPTGTKMLASDSLEVVLVVQEEPIPFYPANPLPTEYWVRPIDPSLREWNVVAGNWLENPTNYYAVGNDYAPDTAHILWSKMLTQGGIVGENLDSHSFEIGDAYEGKFASRLAVAGRLYYDKYASPDPFHEIVCVDLHTGEELWSRVLLNNLTVSFAQLMYWDTYDYHGVYDYIWATGNSGTRAIFDLPSAAGNPYCAFDPITGDFVYALYGMPSGTRVTGPKGEILIYNVNVGAGYMTLWNSSNIPALKASPTQYPSMGWGQWRAMGKVVNATGACITTPETPFGISGYQWNVTIGSTTGRSLPGSSTTIFYGNRVIGGTIDQQAVRLWGISLLPGHEGAILFNNTWNAPSYWAEGNLTVSGFASGWVAWSEEDMVGVMWIRESREHFGFSLETGDNLWGPTPPQYYLDSVEDSPADVRNIAYGNLYSASVSGIVYCYNVTTGERQWIYEAKDPYHEYLFANNWWLKPLMLADGKIYVSTCEHSPIDPRPRGGPFVCLNGTTGEVIFRADGLFRTTRWGGRAVIADSIIAGMDTYSQTIFAFGKGPSATTVSAGPEVSTEGSSVVVKGMVTDVSPGTTSAALMMRFPNGVPAVADANQSEWMMHVYKQNALPADVVGVEVVVSVIDPNNNCYEVARTTSDASGYFSTEFMPEVPGKYTVIAAFEGSQSYYGSLAETALLVEAAPAATPGPTPTPAPMTDTYVLGLGAAAIVAIVIIGLIIILMLRKR